jgi:sec-independent protein translocase protein TatA
MAVFGLPGGMEWVVVLVIALLLFGPTQLPKLAKMFGKSAKALKDGMDAGMNEPVDDEPAPKAPAAPAEKDDAEG